MFLRNCFSFLLFFIIFLDELLASILQKENCSGACFEKGLRKIVAVYANEQSLDLLKIHTAHTYTYTVYYI